MANPIVQWFRRSIARIGASSARRGLLPLNYFEDVLAVEFGAIDARRAAHGRSKVSPLASPPGPDAAARRAAARAPQTKRSRKLSPDPAKLFASASEHDAVRHHTGAPSPVDPAHVDYDKTRPQPVPCDANGLAFSGGGIRSGAVCLGALQALHERRILESIDYLSTVSGGGYAGACLTAAMSSEGGRAFPFGDDVFDSAAVAHLRNYSNYLMPRGRSGVRNVAEAAAIILRGLLANLVIVLALLLAGALITLIAYPGIACLHLGSFVPRLIDGVFGSRVDALVGAAPFALTLWMIALVAVTLIGWALLRSYARFDGYTDDSGSYLLVLARILLITTAAIAFLDLQPIAIQFLAKVHLRLEQPGFSAAKLKALVAALGTLSGAVSAFSGFLGNFLKTSEHAKDWTTLALRIATQAVVFLAALVLPVAIWIAYLELSLRGMSGSAVAEGLPVSNVTPSSIVRLYLLAFVIAAIITFFLEANGYSLHRFYRDRLSRAFLFRPPPLGVASPEPLDTLRLTQLRGGAGPYPILNSALNVEGSKEANRRGRNADFFMFTPDFVGSDLTHYANAQDMEEIDARLNLATAMAISGAAVSANMGSATIRALSPTLALLNVRLGYWLCNPLDLATQASGWAAVRSAFAWLFGKFYLLLEMLNLIDETSRNILLTDGGHIENLGIYELLKRGCQLIIVVDVDADPSMSFGALMTLERYARIDLGVRVALPWEDIAATTKSVDADMDDGPPSSHGPHCAIGRIFYETGAQGVMVYFKASLTGDEKDYILDYKKRYPSFPHESTGDQFFSEEQFEAYRALGYHMVDGVFSGSDNFSYLSTGPGAFLDLSAAVAAVRAMLGAGTLAWVAV
jgi:predicted acylesterase/phospholipase RssA